MHQMTKKWDQARVLETKVISLQKENVILKTETNKLCEQVNDIEKEYSTNFDKIEQKLKSA